MAHSFAVSAPAPGGSGRVGVKSRFSPVELGRDGPATIVRLEVPEALTRAGRVFTELTDLAIAGRGRLVICLCKATECTQEWLAALSALAHRCEVMGGRLIVCGAVDPLEVEFAKTGLARRVRNARARHANARQSGASSRDRVATPV